MEGNAPSAEAPIRAVLHAYSVGPNAVLESHSWGKVIFARQGFLQVCTSNRSYSAPAWRAIWVPPHTAHAVHVLENSRLYTLYLRRSPAHWRDICRVLDVSSLLRETVIAMAEEDRKGAFASLRFRCLSILTLSELAQAQELPLAFDLPQDPYLQNICDAFLRSPHRSCNLRELALRAGVTVGMIQYLFQKEMCCSFVSWREKVLLVQSIVLVAQGKNISEVAAELGYDSVRDFSHSVHELSGMPPGKFFGKVAR